MKPEAFLNQVEREAVIAAVREAEKLTSGEIRVFISSKGVDDPVTEAEKQFQALGMEQTRERNGVLILVCPKSQRFAVVGDEGIHTRCGKEFWEGLVQEMGNCFKKSEFTAGLVIAIQKAGERLQEHFPRRPDDRNELPDAIGQD